MPNHRRAHNRRDQDLFNKRHTVEEGQRFQESLESLAIDPQTGSFNHRPYRDDAYGGNISNNSYSHGNTGRLPRGGEKGRRGHPPGLTGKAIGLYYRDLAKEKKVQKTVTGVDELHYYGIDTSSAEKITNLISTLDNSKELTHPRDSRFTHKYLEILSGSIQEKIAKSVRLTLGLKMNDDVNEQLKEEQRNREVSERYQAMFKFRSKLPSYGMKNEILNIINENQVTVISGETGCGKTTQVPQFILDDAIEHNRGSVTKIVCTQPRRISAISVAERVAAERGENLGTSVGYQIRLEKILCRDYGSILFCTTGLLLQIMQGDPALRDFSHLILDEIHERNTDSDFIITLLKQVIVKRPDLKVILMSATLNAETFSKYYDNCPNLHIPGFTYPVTEYYLEDIVKITRFNFSFRKSTSKELRRRDEEFKTFSNFIKPFLSQLEADGYPRYVISELRNFESETLSLELVQSLLEYISSNKGPGAILVFLPGLMDISNLTKNLLASGRFPSHKFQIYPLHSRLPTTEQRLIFKTPPPSVRKIVIATSIAETSITIEDVVYVVDCGKTKLTRFDVIKNVETLEPEWVSLANAKQRRGRAGRVQPGECYRLYTRGREMTFEQYPTPEMLRTPLENVILQAKLLQLGRIAVFLGSVLDPPTEEAIEVSLESLRTLNAIDANENLTPLGYHLASLPLDPRTGKMVLLASMFSCVEPIFAIAASLSFKDAFCCPLGKEKEANTAKLNLGLNEYSDHIALAEALRRYEVSKSYRDSGRFCFENFLSRNTLNLLIEMKQQFARYLYEMQFLHSENPSDPRSNRNSINIELVKAIVCAGLFPNIAVANVTKSRRMTSFVTVNGETVKIHPSSINNGQAYLPTRFVTYYLKQKSTAIYLHDTSCVRENAIIFAAPKCSIQFHGMTSHLILQNSLTFRCGSKTADIVQRLREEWDKLLENKILHPGTVKWESQEGKIMQAIIEFISGKRWCQ